MLRQYEDQQAALQTSREADLRRLEESKLQQQRDFEEQQRMQQERERAAQEELMRQQAMQFGQQNQGRIAELEREILALRGEYERNQIMLERYDNVSPLQLVALLETDGLDFSE